MLSNFVSRWCGPALLLAAVVRPGAVNAADRPDSAPLTYTVSITGVKNRPLETLLRAVSDSVVREKNPPPTRELLEAMAEDDVGKMKKVLRSRGYYDGTVSERIKQKHGTYTIVFEVAPGEPFRFSRVEITLDGSGPEDVELPPPAAIGLSPGSPASSLAIVEAGKKLLRSLRSRGYMFAVIAERRVAVDYAQRAVDVTFQVRPGEQARFGPTEIEGLERVREAFVRDLIPWREGEIYDPVQLQSLRDRLNRSGLFSMVMVTHREAVDREGLLATNIRLLERERHSVALKAGYRTDRGLGGGLWWQNRNLFGGGQQLSVGLQGWEESYAGEIELQKPQFLHPDQKLTGGLYLIDDRPDAYTSRRLRGSAIVERTLPDGFSLSGGIACTQDQVTQLGQTDDYSLLSLPLSAKLVIGSNIAPAPAGAVFSLSGEPYYDLHGGRLYTKIFLENNVYITPPLLSFLTLSGRVSAGSIPDASLDDEIPADQRFYAGGANTVRGYAYQSVGPLVGDDPVGGRSVLTMSLELDARLIGDFGLAAFIDGGAAFEETLPRWGNDILWGAGGGLRYFSILGPIGLDIGFPLDRRKDIDRSYQIYVSIVETF